MSTELLGRIVWTEVYGKWPGGYCEVIKLNPDQLAPEIVFQVKRLKGGDEIGVFGHEDVRLVDQVDTDQLTVII